MAAARAALIRIECQINVDILAVDAIAPAVCAQERLSRVSEESMAESVSRWNL